MVQRWSSMPCLINKKKVVVLDGPLVLLSTYMLLLTTEKCSVLPRKCKKWVPMALLSSYEIYRIAVNNINKIRSSCKFPFVCPILTKFGVLRQILVKTQISNFMKIRRMGAALKREDRRNDRQDETKGAFRELRVCEHA
jgi:hypothetical protein